MSNSRLLVTGTFPNFCAEYLENSKRSLDTKMFLSYIVMLMTTSHILK